MSQVCCRLVGFGRVASKVTCLPVKPDRVRKYLSGVHYQYTPLYPASVSGPGGSTTMDGDDDGVMQRLVTSTEFVRGVEVVVGSRYSERMRKSVVGEALGCAGARPRRVLVCTRVTGL